MLGKLRDQPLVEELGDDLRVALSNSVGEVG